MSPEDQASLATFASSAIINIIDVISISVGYGVLLLMTFVALRVLSMKSYKPSKLVYACCIAMLVVFTVVLIYITSFTFVLVAGEAQKISAKSANNQVKFWSYMGPMVQAVPILIGDSVVVWRAWVLLPPGRVWKIVVSLIMVGNIGVNIAYCVSDNIFTLGQIEGFGTSWDWISLLVSLLVNVSMTFFIMWKWWDHQDRSSSVSARSHKLQKVLLLMIESGAIFCGTQSLTLIFTLIAHYVKNPPVELVEAIRTINAIFRVATAWYPAAVIILVNTNSPFAKPGDSMTSSTYVPASAPRAPRK